MGTLATKLMTAEELLQLPRGRGKRYELVKGELITRAPAGGEHGRMAMDLGYFLNDFVRKNQLGVVFAAETGFIIRRNPDTVRAPDAAFVSHQRLKKHGLPTIGYYPCAPDLVVEVLSPNDGDDEVATKTNEWFEGGARMVWVVNPKRKTVAVFTTPHDAKELTIDDTLGGDPVLPGFTLPLKEIFPSA
jgi:Uma2 family endonuclease